MKKEIDEQNLKCIKVEDEEKLTENGKGTTSTGLIHEKKEIVDVSSAPMGANKACDEDKTVGQKPKINSENNECRAGTTNCPGEIFSAVLYIGGNDVKLATSRCSVPQDVLKCSVCKVDVDKYTQNLLKHHMHVKIFDKNNKTKSKHNLKTCSSTFGKKVTDEVQQDSNPLKIDEEHFRMKRMKIDTVDVADLAKPIRSSTPTPLDATIMAGNLSFFNNETCDEKLLETEKETGVKAFEKQNTLEDEDHKQDLPNMPQSGEDGERADEDNMEEKEHSTCPSDDSDEVFLPFMKRIDEKRKYLTEKYKCKHEGAKLDEEVASKLAKYTNPDVSRSASKHNASYCRNWVSNNNAPSSEPPPTVYRENGKDMSALMDMTSISCRPLNTNITQNAPSTLMMKNANTVFV